MNTMIPTGFLRSSSFVPYFLNFLMIRFFSAFFTVLLAVSLLASPSAAQRLQPLDRIAAIVDEDVILQSELQQAITNIRAQYANQPYQLPPQAVLERQVLERLVLVKLQVARAEKSGIRVGEEELEQAIAAIAQQNNISVDGLRQQLAREGISLADFRRSIRDEIMLQHLRHSFAQSRISVSEGEIDAALRLQAASSGVVRYHLAHIMVALPEGATVAQIATGQSKIEGIKALIDRGEMEFSAAAVRYSDSPNALEGGDLGWRSLDEIPAAFASQVPNMQVGQVIGPIQGASGFQLLKLVDIRHGERAQTVTEYFARHILLRVDHQHDEASARAKIQTLRAQIAGGADFQDIARQSSEDANSRNQGGDLGWFSVDTYGTDFGRQVEALANGAISAPFRSPAGWHIVQRVNSRQVDVGEANQRAQMREQIGRRKLEEEYNRFLQELRGEAYVSFRTGDPAEN